MPSLAKRFVLDDRAGLLLKASAAALLLVACKMTFHQLGWEPIRTLSLLTALMGGVVFTLAILLAGTLSDFKEAERLVGELASHLRQLYWDLEPIGRDPQEVSRSRHDLGLLVRRINGNLRNSRRWDDAGVRAALDTLNAYNAGSVRVNAVPTLVRTVQVNLGHIQRLTDRIGTIAGTTFTRAGYAFSGAVVSIALAALMLTRIEPYGQGLFLYGFSGFLLLGLYLFIWDLDNPFEGHARISTKLVDEVEAFLDSRQASAGPEAHPTARPDPMPTPA